MGDDLAPEEKLRIAGQFVMNSPPGQVQKVVEDCRTLVGDAVLTEAELAKMVAKVNKEKFLAVAVPQDDAGKFEQRKTKPLVLLTPEGEFDDGTFLEPTTGQYLVINHPEQMCVGSFPLTEEKLEELEQVEGVRKDVDEHMVAYAQSWLPDAVVTTYAKKLGTQVMVTCCIGRCNINLGNYWAGMWRSQWTLLKEEGETSGSLTGIITCQVHYFEDGNVQLDDGVKISTSIPLSGRRPDNSEMSAGDFFAEKVQQLDAEFIKSLEEIYTQMSDSVLTALRRKLPVTREKFDWDKKAAVHKLASELNKLSNE